MMKRINLLLISCLVMSQMLFSAEVTKKIEKKLDLPEKGKLILQNQFGSIHIEGWEKPGAQLVLDIKVKAKRERQLKKLIDSYQLNIDKRGNSIAITTKDVKEIFGDFNGSVEFDYTIKCHNSVALELRNRFGNIVANNFKSSVRLSNTNGAIEARNHNQLEVHNKFGSVEVANVNGIVQISNTNGRVDVRESREKIRINNSFGDTYIHDCQGIVEIGSKNGRLEVQNIENSRLSCTNQFGNTEVLSVTGKTYIASRNGALRIEKINGDTEVSNEFGETNIKHINGSLNIQSQNGQIILEDIKGDLNLDNCFADNILRDIQGTSQIHSENGKIVLTNAMQPVSISNSFASTILSDVNPEIKIETSNGNVQVKNLKKGLINININNSFAEIEVELPKNYKGAEFYQTEFGKIRRYAKKFKEMNATMINRKGETEDRVELKTSNGDIKVTEK